MPTITLDATTVRTSICPAGQRKLDLYDTQAPGLVLEIRPSGGKTYYLRYRDTHGKQRQHRIGDAAVLSLDQARNAALTTRARIILGEDPVEEKRTLRQIPTLAAFALERYLPYVQGYKRAWKCDETWLRVHILPKFGQRYLDEISQGEVIAFQHAKRAEGYKPATVNRFIILLRYAYNLAKKWRIPGADKNPAAGIPLFEENNQKERYLSADESQRLVAQVRQSPNPQLQYIVPLLILLGCRKRELLGSEWSHFDLERRTWRIPLSKSGKARHVPLSADVIAILGQLPRWEGCPYVVPNPKTKKPFQSVFHAWDTARQRAGLADVRMHDLRHSTASFLVNSGRSLYEVQKILGHTQLKTTQRYAHLSQETLLEAVDSLAGVSGLSLAVA